MRLRLEAMVNPIQQEDLGLVPCMSGETWIVDTLRLCVSLHLFILKINPEVKTCPDIIHKIF